MKNLRKPLELDSSGRAVLPKSPTNRISGAVFKDIHLLDEEEIAYYLDAIEHSELVALLRLI